MLALIGWGLVYPFLPGMLDAFWLGWANIVSLLLIAATALHLAPVSRPAMLLVLPSLPGLRSPLSRATCSSPTAGRPVLQ